MNDDPLLVLSALVEGDLVSMSEADAVSALGAGLQPLLESGVLFRTAPSLISICEACNHPHPVDLEFDDLRQCWGYRCDVGGWHRYDRELTSTVDINLDELAALLAGALGASEETRRTLIEGSLYCLGVVPGLPSWTIFFARKLTEEDAFEAARRELARPVGKEPGLLITTSSIPRSIPMPNRHRIAYLQEVVCLTSLGLEQVSGVDRLLRSGRRAPQKRGRKSLQEDAREILRSRHRHRLNMTADEHVDAVIRELKKRHPDAKIASRKVVRYDWLGDLLD